MKKLTIGVKYRVQYMPTIYLYDRVGVLVLQTEKSLKFDLEDDGHYFQTKPEFIKSIEAI